MANSPGKYSNMIWCRANIGEYFVGPEVSDVTPTLDSSHDNLKLRAECELPVWRDADHEDPSQGVLIDHHLEWDIMKPAPVFVTLGKGTITRCWPGPLIGHQGLSWPLIGCDCPWGLWPVSGQCQGRCEHGGNFTALLVYCPSSHRDWGVSWVFPRTRANCLWIPASVKNQIQTHYQYRISPLFRAHLEILSATAFDPIGSSLVVDT